MNKSNQIMLKVLCYHPYNISRNQSIHIPLTPLIQSSKSIPENLFSCGTYTFISALFDKEEKNKFKRYIKKPFQYTWNFTSMTFLNQYYQFTLFEIFKKKTLKKELLFNILTSTSSVILTNYKEKSSEIFWNVITQFGSNTIFSLLNYYLND